MATSVKICKSASKKVWTVVLNRSSMRNAVDRATAIELHDAFVAFEKDKLANCAVLYGEGGFCAGADLKAFDNLVEEPQSNKPLQVGPMGPTRLQLSKPVIAAVEGHAVAGGLELACWCDLRVADPQSIFGVFCRRWGVPLIDGGTVNLPRLIGHSHAMDMILTGRPVGAVEALAFGLINRIAKEGYARIEAEQMAEQIASFPQKCLRSDRRSVISQWSLTQDHAYHHEYILGKEVMEEAVAGAKKFSEDGMGRSGTYEDFY
jgi:enoyl-CoA hydratase